MAGKKLSYDMSLKSGFTILICIILSTACKKHADRKNISDFGNEFVHAAVEGDTAKVRDMFVNGMQGVDATSRLDLYKSFDPYRKTEVKLIKVDTSVFKGWDPHKYADYTFKLDTNYTIWNCEYITAEKGDIAFRSVKIMDITKECASSLEEPYCPKDAIEFKRVNWSSDYWNKMFVSAHVEVHNNSPNDIETIKFRVKGFNNDEMFYNQTISRSNKIYAGDIVTFQLPEITAYYAGFKIDKNTIEFTAELLEVMPRQMSDYCKQVKEMSAIDK